MKRPWITVLLWLVFPLELSAQNPNNHPPIALAGLTQYASHAPAQLDGTASFDPDDPNGLLIYQWRQVSGTPLELTEAHSATPKVWGFAMDNTVQRFTFELVVSDGLWTSEPNTVELVVVQDFGSHKVEIVNPPFDANKPTFIGFSGGDCYNGRPYEFTSYPALWREHLNIISTKGWYRPPYFLYADAAIKLLSEVAPRYHQKIQTAGFSTGGQPAMDVALRLNGVYSDPRYNVNHVSLFDAKCRYYQGDISQLNRLQVDGESCWVANYTIDEVRSGTLNIVFPGHIHQRPRRWHDESIHEADWSRGFYNFGVYGGFYLSVAGPARHLQLGPQPEIYRFEGGYGELDLFDEDQYPGLLPEPVALLALTVPDTNEVYYTCQESRNVVGYEFLTGTDPHRVQHFTTLLDTPTPPTVFADTVDPNVTWWTIRARDAHGSIIYADPLPLGSPSPGNTEPGIAELHSAQNKPFTPE